MEDKIKIYSELPYLIKRELDQKAYSKYFDEHFDQSDNLLTFNIWYGTEQHKKYLNIYLRKYKLEKIMKNNENDKKNIW